MRPSVKTDFSTWTVVRSSNMIRFILMSFVLATRTDGITVDTLSSADWQPSNRNARPVQRVPSSGTISLMRPPPPPQELRPRVHPRPPNPSVTSHNKYPVNQRPSVLPAVSYSQFPSYQDDDRTVRSNFAQFPQGSFRQNNAPENVRQQLSFNQNIVDSSSRKPQQFTDPSDSSISDSIVNKQLATFPDRQQFQFPSSVFRQGYTQQQIGSNTENSLTLNQSRFVQNTTPSRNTWNQNGREHANRPHVENFGKLQHTTSSQIIQYTVPQASPPTEYKQVLSNISNYHSLEPDVQFTQSIEASEHHSIYHAPPVAILHSEQVPSAIRITNPPVLGPATRSVSENQLRTTSAPDIKKKVTLKDILDEDCPKAKEIGYCASPPRYPSQQISQLMTRCVELLKYMYVPVPEDLDDEYAWDTTTHSFNSTRNMERGNRHVWSWARPGDSQQTVCDSERQRIEPGYVLESPSLRWYVVLQGSSMTQHVMLDKCRNVGKPCSATKCARSNGFRNNAAKGSSCVQRYSYSHLVTWDPDKPDLCPRIRVFRFPTACVCYLTSSYKSDSK